MNNNEDNNYIDVESLPVNGDKTEFINTEEYSNQYNNFNNNNKPKKNRKSGKVLAKIAGGLLITMMGGAFGSGITYTLMNKNNKQATTANATTTYVPQSFTESESDAMSAADAFNKVSPAVVIITVTTTSSTNSIFGGTQEAEGMGSGFIINEDGSILTNYHVIEGATSIKVTLSDGNEVSASVVNYDQNKDVAMIKLAEGTKVPAVAELGDSDAIYPGAEVIAIGTPLSKNLAYTLTKGVVSGSKRSIESSTGVQMNLIQTDAAINAGNSGGPLVNTKGQVIGINSMKLGSQTLGSTSIEGIGFAIPINDVKEKIDSLSKQILNLGVKVRELDSETAKKYNLVEGLYIAEVEEFSPAEKGGLKVGDIIVKADGTSITTLDELKEIKNKKDAGDSLSLQVVRDNKNVDLSIVLEASAS